MALDKFFCKVPETKATDKQIEFPSEKEAIEYCKEHSIDPHNVILIGDKYVIKTKDSGFKITMDKAIRMCDMKASYKEQAEAVGKRYLAKMKRNGFEV